MFLDIENVERNKTAIHDDSGTQLTYGELCDFITEIEELKLMRSVVFCLCENTAGALAGIAAFESVRVVPLLLSAAIDSSLLEELDTMYTPYYYWIPDAQKTRCNGDVIYSKYGYSLLRSKYDVYPIHEKLALLMTTSGSTGSPKLVRYKYGNLEANARNVAAVFGWTSDENCIMDLPVQYTMGLNVINSHFIVGATVLLVKNNLMSSEFWDFIKENHGSNFTGVPYSYEIMMKLKFTRMDLPDLKTLSEGGGKLTDEMFKMLAEYSENAGKRFCATFGTTETSARMAYLPPEMAREKIGSIGKAIPEGELFLLDVNGNEIEEPEAQGELGYRGPNVTMGYGICRDDLLKGDEWFGEYHTGDIAKRDAEGFYYIIGRKKRFLKLFGLRISLDQSERIIKEGFNCECACTGNDEKMKIFIIDGALKDKIPAYLAEKLNLNASAFEVKVIEELPKNESGKILYKNLN
ncbi:AMP-binding protein [Clostridium transplantifaecale]|uniref:AMP-binding protein n=1 Tax=Clostridium transplantifaecale TaxID=2479838 RepID=UPI000F63BEDF|nr:AMP-binding protein [Clostridium transplantifaecale]